MEGFPSGLVVKNPPANAGDAGSITRWRRSPGEGNVTPLQYSCLGNGQRSLVGYNPWGHKRVRHDLATKQQVLWMKVVKFLEHLYSSEITRGAIESIYPFSL